MATNRERLRRQIAHEAANLLQQKRADSLHAARVAAARRIVRGRTPAAAMPTREDVLAVTAQRRPETTTHLPPPYDAYLALLQPLEHVRMPRADHPEGDALYHVLQTYARVREALPYDLEAMLAGLLHEVGRSLDVVNPEATTLVLLEGLITERTRRLLEALPLERRRLDGEAGFRAARRHRFDEEAEVLTVLARADRDGRQCGAAVPPVEEALADLAAFDDDVPDEECPPDESNPGVSKSVRVPTTD